MKSVKSYGINKRKPCVPPSKHQKSTSQPRDESISLSTIFLTIYSLWIIDFILTYNAITYLGAVEKSPITLEFLTLGFWGWFVWIISSTIAIFFFAFFLSKLKKRTALWGMLTLCLLQVIDIIKNVSVMLK